MESRFWCVFIVCCALSALASPPAASTFLRGTVRDSAGAVIPGAEIFVHWNCARAYAPRKPLAQDVFIKADANGEFSVAVVSGFYDVCAHAKNFSPACETVRATEGQTEHYNPVLKVNQSIVEEYGDRFFESGPPAPIEPSKLPDSGPR